MGHLLCARHWGYQEKYSNWEALSLVGGQTCQQLNNTVGIRLEAYTRVQRRKYRILPMEVQKKFHRLGDSANESRKRENCSLVRQGKTSISG